MRLKADPRHAAMAIAAVGALTIAVPAGLFLGSRVLEWGQRAWCDLTGCQPASNDPTYDSFAGGWP